MNVSVHLVVLGHTRYSIRFFHRFNNIPTRGVCNYSKLSNHGAYKMSKQNLIINAFWILLKLNALPHCKRWSFGLHVTFWVM